PRAPGRFLTWLAVSVVTSFSLVWLYVAMFPLAYVSGDYLLAHLQRQRLAACDVGDVAVFGDSRAEAAIMPVLVPERTMNFALPASNPVATMFAVEQALKCTASPR